MFDTHAHYDTPEYDTDRAETLRFVRDAGVLHILNVSYDMTSSARSVALAEAYPFVRAAVGVHPLYIRDFDDAAKQELQALLRHPSVVAAGECGLDYYALKNRRTGDVVLPEADVRRQQREVFAWQLQLCVQSGLPAVVHSVAAAQDTLELLRAYPTVRGVMHGFSYSVEVAMECVKMGWRIGIGMGITRPGARKIREVAAKIPIEAMLIETDCPYQVTDSMRGERGDSRMLSEIVPEIAKLRGISPEEVVMATTENASRLFF